MNEAGLGMAGNGSARHGDAWQRKDIYLSKTRLGATRRFLALQGMAMLVRTRQCKARTFIQNEAGRGWEWLCEAWRR
jgi:hypothetical protein